MKAYERPSAWRLLLVLAVLAMVPVAAQVGNAPEAEAWEDADLGPDLTYCHPEIPGTNWPQPDGCTIGYNIRDYYDCCDPMPGGPLVNYGGPVFDNVRMGVTHYGSHFTQEREFIVRADYAKYPGDGNQRVEWETLSFLTPGITQSQPHILHADPVTSCPGNATSCTYKIRPVDLANAVEFGAGDEPSWYFAPIQIMVAYEGGADGRFAYGWTWIALGMYLTENQVPTASISVAGDDGSDDLTYLLRGLVSDDPADHEQHHYYWDFGDGTRVDGYQLKEVEHTYAAPGNYRVTLAVTDPDGAEGFDEAGLGDRLQITKVEIPDPPTHVGDEFDVHVTARNGATRALHCVNPGGIPDIRPATSFEVVSRPPSFVRNTLAPRGEITFDFRFRVKNVLPSTLEYHAAVRANASTVECPASPNITVHQQLDVDLPAGPPPPTEVSASPGDGAAVVTWEAPDDPGALPLLDYTATATPGGAHCSTTTLGCTISGLTNGTEYAVTVTSSNANGAGAASAPVSVTPAAPLGAPTGVNAKPRDRAALVSWTPPASTGGSPITGYVVVTAPGGKTCSTTGATSCTVKGLTNGTAYSFRAQATTGLGDGPLSAASGKVTPRTVPGEPRRPSASGKPNASATVSWIAPVSNGGAPITGYRVRSSPGNKTCTTTGATSCRVTGLRVGTEHTFTVEARNAAGWGAPSSPTRGVKPQR